MLCSSTLEMNLAGAMIFTVAWVSVLKAVHTRNIDQEQPTADHIYQINEKYGITIHERILDGDIMTKKEQSHRTKRNVVKDKDLIWESGEIPYEIDNSLTYYQKSLIEAAIAVFEDKTCIQFRQREASDKHGVKFVQGVGCWSYLGRVIPDDTTKNYQEVSLGAGCISKGIVLHEILHFLGFYHEHTRYDRDEYIKVNWKNIKTGSEKHFELVDQSAGDFILPGYDYESLLHYGRIAFSANGQPTLQARDDPMRMLGQNDGLSRKDIEKVNKLYKCKEKKSKGWSNWSKWSECYGDRKQSRSRYCLQNDLNACASPFEIIRRRCTT